MRYKKKSEFVRWGCIMLDWIAFLVVVALVGYMLYNFLSYNPAKMRRDTREFLKKYYNEKQSRR